MSKGLLSTQDVKELIDEQGVGLTVEETKPATIQNDELKVLWLDAQEALEKIENFIRGEQ